MKTEIGKPYNIADRWIAGLQSAHAAILVKVDGPPGAHTFTAWGPHREPIEYPTAEEAIAHAPTCRIGHNDINAYEDLADVILSLDRFLATPPVWNFNVLIPLIGHHEAYCNFGLADAEHGQSYWEAAARIKPRMSDVETYAASPHTLEREWALRLGYLHGRPLSADELVSLCTSEQQTTREFALTASAGEKPPTARTASRRKV